MFNFTNNDVLRFQVGTNQSFITLFSMNFGIGLPQSTAPTSANLTIVRLK